MNNKSITLAKIGGLFAVITSLSPLSIFLIEIPIPIISPFLYLFGNFVPISLGMISECILIYSTILIFKGVISRKPASILLLIYLSIGLLSILELP